jgi:arylamine N-acetyltransferase
MRWKSGKKEGCTTIKILPARPNGNGVYAFQQTQCEDGVYVAAYTFDGVQLWRRKISDSPSQTGSNDYESEGEHLEAHPASICDAVQVGTEQEKIRALLTEQHLSFSEQPGAEHVWLVEQSNAQCRLQFDDKLMLVKKKKVFVVE